MTSGTTVYHPNPSEVACARTYHGPWTVLGDPHPGDRSRTSWNSQISSVFRHPAKQDLYIALADRWVADLPERIGERFATGGSYAAVAHAMAAEFDPDGAHGVRGSDQLSREADAAPLAPAAIRSLTVAVNTSVADYVWLPFRFDGDRPYLDWRDEWRIE